MFALLRHPSPARYLTILATLALGIISILGITEQVLIQNALQQIPSNTTLINIAGQQEMFSQKISKNALAVQVALLTNDTVLEQEARDELSSTLVQWQHGHTSLINGYPKTSASNKNNSTILQLFDKIEPHYFSILYNTTYLLKTVDTTSSPPQIFVAASVHAIFTEVQEYIRIMNTILMHYQTKAQTQSNGLESDHQVWLAVLLITVGLEAIFICRPAIKKISEIVRELEESKQHAVVSFEEQRQLNHLKDQMLLNVNHELRTLMTSVYGYLELLHDHFDTLNEQTREVFFSQAIRGCEEFQVHVNIVLNTLKVGNNARPLTIESLPVSQVINSVLDLFDPKKKNCYTIEQKISGNLLILADRQSLYQVLRNLISNAFKYVPQNSTLTISAEAREDSGTPTIRIAVKDQGHGIPASEVTLLFNRFVRLQRDLNSTINGSGLGLYISKQLVEGMKGRIWVESTGIEGEGSCFFIELPASPSESDVQSEDVPCLETAVEA